MALWHERDISHSSVERVILPDSTTLLHYMLQQGLQLMMDGLRVFPERMEENLESDGGLYHSGAVLLALARRASRARRPIAWSRHAAMRSLGEGEATSQSLARKDERDPPS